MKISLAWIGDYVTLPAQLSAQQIAHDLTMTTVEVESVHQDGQGSIFEIDNKSITNRPDLWGHYGIARELSAIYRVPLRPLPATEPELAAITLLSQIDPTGCRRFTAMRIERADATPTPDAIARRLSSVGQRPRGLLYADLTNYVMLATGQPCHAFDADTLDLPLSVRRAHAGERFRALDGTDHTLSPSDLVVADRTKAVALAGIIGGLDTAISPSTRTVLLEIANFDPLSIRRTSASLGIRTEASTRFEKSLSTGRIDEARRLFFELLTNLSPNALITGFEDRHIALTPDATIHTSGDFVRRRIGKALSIDELREPLEHLGFGVAVAADALTVTVPDWRNTGDISGPHDLVEEIARLHGYENFAFQAPLVRLERTARDYPRNVERRVKEYLAFVCGMREVVTYPWIETAYITGAGLLADDDGLLRLATPPAPDQAALRTSLVPGLLKSIASNVRWAAAFKVFESGIVFPAGKRTPMDDVREHLPPQPKRLAAACVGPDVEALFRHAKGVVEAIRHN